MLSIQKQFIHICSATGKLLNLFIDQSHKAGKRHYTAAAERKQLGGKWTKDNPVSEKCPDYDKTDEVRRFGRIVNMNVNDTAKAYKP